MTAHPLPPGTRVYHRAQQWAPAVAPDGTAEIIRHTGPDAEGAFEYLVRTGRNLARRPAPDNPEDRETWWSSRATIPAHTTEEHQ